MIICRAGRLFWMALLALLVCVQALGQGAAQPQYRLGSGDRLKITVYGHEDLSGEFQIDGVGAISMPLIREIQAAGRTLDELAAAIVDALEPDYLRDPRVTVEILNYRPYYIIGEVKTPGSYPYVNGITVVTAVATAGGFTYRARKNRIVITRTQGDTTQKIPADMGTKVLPGDVIEVPERFF